MTAFTLASWNINSVRLRAPMVAEWVRQADPDVLCLQEIKCLAEQFPEEAFREMGFRHFHVRGQKGMHGVAIASKLPLEDLPDEDLCPKAEARHQRVMVEGIELHNFYIPAGGDEPDPAINPRFAHKLAFLERIEFRGLRSGTALVGSAHGRGETLNLDDKGSAYKVRPRSVGAVRILSRGLSSELFPRAARNHHKKVVKTYATMKE